MGMSVTEFNDMKQLEVITFRRHILDVCQEAISERTEGGRMALYKYPPNIESKAEPPDHVRQAIRECMFFLYNFILSVFRYVSQLSR